MICCAFDNVGPRFAALHGPVVRGEGGNIHTPRLPLIVATSLLERRSDLTCPVNSVRRDIPVEGMA